MKLHIRELPRTSLMLCGAFTITCFNFDPWFSRQMESHALPVALALGGPDARAGTPHDRHYLQETKTHQEHVAGSTLTNHSNDAAKACCTELQTRGTADIKQNTFGNKQGQSRVGRTALQ